MSLRRLVAAKLADWRVPVLEYRGCWWQDSNNTYVSSAITAKNQTLAAANKLYVYSRGTADDISVTSTNTRLYVHNGGIATNINVTNRGVVFVYSGGIVQNATASGIADSRGEIILRGGAAYGTVINWQGVLTVSDGGVAVSAIKQQDNNAGEIVVSSGGIARDCMFSLNNNNIRGGYASGCYADPDTSRQTTVMISGGTLVNYTTYQQGTINVSNGGKIINVVMSGDAVKYTYSLLAVSTGASGVNVSGVGRCGTVGGYISRVRITTGSAYVNGGVMHDIIAPIKVFVSGGGVISSALLLSGANLQTKSKATLYDVVVSSGGSMTISSGCAAFRVTSMTGCKITSVTGGTVTYVSGVQLYNNTTQISSTTTWSDATISGRTSSAVVYNNGTATNIIASASANVHVSAGGILNGGTMNYYCKLNVCGGTVSNTNIGSWCSAHVSWSGAVSNSVITSYGSAIVEDLGNICGGTIQRFASAIIKRDGTISDITITSYGRAIVSEGGVGSNVTIASHAYLTISSGGYVSNVDVQALGNLILYGGTALNVSSATTAYIVVSNGGVITYAN